jgi:secreted PhoX family phosphatase
LASGGRVVIYTGDDSRFEYIYKFVSRDVYDPVNRAANRDLLDHGTLYAGKFNNDGTGTWLPLVHGQNGLTAANGFADQAAVLVYAKLAGDRVGATKMDRPEWIVIHPKTGEVYASLTYNDQRGIDGKPGTDAANPRNKNVFGQIIRWRESAGNAASTTFDWDLFVLAGDAAHEDPLQRGNIKGDAFACPDTLRFSPNGTLWIGTDTDVPGRGAYKNLGNNQLLAVDSVTGEIRRFLTGPRGCEITGLSFTPDGKAAFLNIQHPGENILARDDPPISNWPSGVTGAKPRSATIVITRNDGGVIGA